MADTHTKEQRSRNMASIRSAGNLTTEIVLAKALRKDGVKGWRRHLKSLPGKPDFTFRKERVAVFVDGCYWHGCRRCALRAKSNKSYWGPKIEANIARDKKHNAELRKMGWTVLRFWEHELKKDSQGAITKIEKALKSRK